MNTQIFNKMNEPLEPVDESVIGDESLEYELPTHVKADAEPETEDIDTDEQSGSNRRANSHSHRGKGPSKFTTGVYDWVSALLAAVVILVVVMTFCVRMVDVDGSSMNDTLQDKDRVIITGLNYEPRVGDIVVISHGVELDKTIVKRIIAIGGQTVDIDRETGEVTVDGILLDEPYAVGDTMVSGDVEFPLTVADGTVFVLGDNRGISKDSRFSDVGLIDVNNIIGKVQFRLYPFNSFGKVE